MEDMYCDNDHINMTPTRYSVLITSEIGDEQIIMKETYGPYEGRAEQHQYIPVRTTCTTSEVWLVSRVLDSVEGRVMNCAYSNRVSWMPMTFFIFSSLECWSQLWLRTDT